MLGWKRGKWSVAKTKMMCPFSNELCKECALYRGRHYYLCFCKKYRGYLDEPKEVTKVNVLTASVTSSNDKFEMPSIIPTSAIDPFAITLKGTKKEV